MIDYRCQKCGRSADKADLVAKQVRFFRLGVAGSYIRARVVAWLCEGCMVDDDDYQKKAFDTVGNKALAS